MGSWSLSRTGVSWWRTATGCWARSTRPRIWCRRRCCARGGPATATTARGRRYGPGCTGSRPTCACPRCVLIAYERGTIDRAALDADELAIAAVTVAEYRAGIELADSAERTADRARALAVITSAVEVLEYTEATAACHARLIAHCPPGWNAPGGSRPDHRRARAADRAHRAGLRRKSPLRRPARSERHRRVSPQGGLDLAPGTTGARCRSASFAAQSREADRDAETLF